jgi:hypothetical protein
MSSSLRIQKLWSWYDNVLLVWDVQAITRIRKHNKTNDLLIHVYNVSGFYIEKLYKKMIIPSFFFVQLQKLRSYYVIVYSSVCR